MTDNRFTFDGQSVTAKRGQSLAAALTDAGHRTFRTTAKSAERGIFCGMGVCQDCLVSIDGQPNQRACMSLASDGMTVTRQVPFPAFSGTAAKAGAPLTLAPDVLVIGGGAGGLSAGIAAARAGADVVLLDERKVSGGQYYKQAADGVVLDGQQRDGADLVAAAKSAGITILSGVELWGAFDDLLFMAQQGDRAIIARPKTAIVATGAYERPVMVPGWTLPGVMTTGAAQTLWRSYQSLAGKRLAICGSGPLNLQVAVELARGGATIVRLAERAAHPVTRPLQAARMAVSGPALAMKGLKMEWALRRLGGTVRYGSDLIGVAQCGNALAATFQSSDGTRDTIEVDVVCMNAGFEPQNEILRLLGVSMHYDPAMGHLRCHTDDAMQTNIRGLYAVGDCKGLGGAPAACDEGVIAGTHAAAAAGFGDAYDLHSVRRRLTGHRRFQSRLWPLYDIAPRQAADMPSDTIICRCEELTLDDIRTGLDDKPGHAGTLKRATRVGMGRCQGRYCGPVAARMVAETTGKPIENLSFFAPRVPIKPVAISSIFAAEEAVREKT
ncbi:2Fe-2S iron-sulfur cluster-binding protein [Loktanella sp. SALINAS62]|uniref:2Fe-2S iron-sulfur cluster-binding protein n=1 Tax=Loktanella sp. SALINAS62 TaxID=2706124 RepID=UPI001B8D0DA4|nr:2Fe-2S iron-sulfur cluster-binding protein [Loktanella sp. SALINAS62]MBS1301488.1 FAD-dependent oxidoreductase [Loktanella sp. SALINAS62]